ncbi:Peptidase M1 membrane alanine aminopeptidase [Fictibacillus macauensis ZFHKF-1]|uniref:Peptidase M1 membrane alanine aminopeptidase n=1 Tax=Fictibacillus macauensis ZFHKF-1 TaxID=1196324 RepID=I8UIN0_9BACL|nr:M1 family metallopeptidase [Fictibacillus macauensis]EIT86755.1 Peptidase M1 membrane alanine aminopeptidase [Fictibacillus macauensis ZFHKF-1]
MRNLKKKTLVASASAAMIAASLFSGSHAFASPHKNQLPQANPHLQQGKSFKFDGMVPKAPFAASNKDAGMKGVVGPTHPDYKIQAYYDGKKHRITGKLSVTFLNNTKKKLDELYFNLWGNAKMYRSNNGGMDVSHVKVNGKRAVYNVDDTALHIPSLSLKKDQKSTVTMDFTVNVPNLPDRFGWYKTTTSLGNWFPILAVYDQKGWNINPYYEAGESFYSLTGDYDVKWTTDKKQVIAATGTEVGKPQKMGNLALHHYKAKDVRDFALEMDSTYKVKSKRVNGVKVNVYYNDLQAKYADSMMESGLKSIKLFSDHFGTYPWPELDIVGMEGWFGGMEYPQLTMISIAGPRSQEWVKSVTAHEIGHQWFYGIIGDNEYDEPWLDESFAAYSQALYGNTLNQLRTPPVGNYLLSSPVSAFTANGSSGINAYYQMIYDYGSRTLNDLRMKLGDDVFYKAMKAYFKEKKFKVTTTKDFMTIMQRESGKNLGEFFQDHRIVAK